MGIEMLIIGAAIAGTAAMASQSGGGGGGISMPSAKANNTSKTAAPVAQLTDTDKMNKRLAASQLTKDWTGGVKLSKPGLLGISGGVA